VSVVYKYQNSLVWLWIDIRIMQCNTQCMYHRRLQTNRQTDMTLYVNPCRQTDMTLYVNPYSK